MSAAEHTEDEEALTYNTDADSSGANATFERYRDNSSEDDDDDTVSPDAPLRLSVEFDGLGRQPRPSLQQRITERIPPSLKKAWRATKTWTKGPRPPRIYTITPFFPKIQHAPIALLDRFAPQRIQRFWLLMALYACWLITFSLMQWKSSSAVEIPGYGTPVRLSCGSQYWGEGNGCGLNGDQCRPFTNASVAFRCPADCHKTLILNPHAVGDQEVVYKPLVVGGPTSQQTGFEDVLVQNAVYRGDSFICASAVHAGFIKNIEGGCGVLTLTGEQSDLPPSKRHGIESTGFDSYFPRTFGFLNGTRAQCKDLRWPALVPSVIFTALLSLFTTDPGVHFWSLFVALFFHTAVFSDPPENTTYYGLLSIAFGRFLPACFCAWVTYKYTVKRSLTGLTAQVEKTVLWLGPAWVGALNNYTFDKIPIQRLTPHDIKAQPGAVPALIIVVLSIFFIALGQAWAFRVEGRMPRYLFIYGVMSATLIVFVIIPGLNLRIHHYILALLLLPGTSFQNRPSLIYQGLLLGLFINGTARWGFASIVELPTDLLRDAQQNTLLPVISVLAIEARNITFNMGALPIYDPKAKITYDGVSVLVNDIERFRGYGDDVSYWDDDTSAGQIFKWTWTRHCSHRGDSGFAEEDQQPSEEFAQRTQQLPEYFRFAYMAGNRVGDYSKAGRWDENGAWTPMKPGPSL